MQCKCHVSIVILYYWGNNDTKSLYASHRYNFLTCSICWLTQWIWNSQRGWLCLYFRGPFNSSLTIWIQLVSLFSSFNSYLPFKTACFLFPFRPLKWCGMVAMESPTSPVPYCLGCTFILLFLHIILESFPLQHVILFKVTSPHL